VERQRKFNELTPKANNILGKNTPDAKIPKAIVLQAGNLSFADIDPEEIARQLTIMEVGIGIHYVYFFTDFLFHDCHCWKKLTRHNIVRHFFPPSICTVQIIQPN
jgi:hypothetical protein